MSIAINVVASIGASLLINNQVNPNGDIRTIIVIALVNAIVIPIISTIGLQIRKLLRKYGFKDREIIMLEIISKKVLEDKLIELKSKAEKDDNIILFEETFRQLERVRKEIKRLEIEMEKEEI